MSKFGVKVKLVGRDGNAFAVLGECRRAARKAGISQEDTDMFVKKATSGNYDQLLATCLEYFEVS